MLKQVVFEEAFKALNEGFLIEVRYEGKTERYQLGNRELKGYDVDVVVNEFNNGIHNTMHDLNWRFVLNGEWFIDTESEILINKPLFWEQN